ncbi:hypothetical protein E8E14_004178 [Neopestalotiopsis sp. 37M]|nr:hypothetical protein E8E14_004178 [Neopestalotiopsis sp. 37M]
MKTTTAGLLSSLATLAAAAQPERTFAVLRFDGDGFMTEGRVDPIVSPGTAASHFHGIMGGSSFGTTVEGDQLLDSTCTTAKIKNDKSNYWAPQVYFRDPNNGTFTKVPLFYMNVYYFFEPTDDDTVAFPVGLKMFTGDAKTRDPPAFGGGSNLDPDAGPIQNIQFTCPRTSYDPPSYPADSDGTSAGMQDPQNKGAGAGFPLYPCDGYASPLRADIHFPSCYNPDAGLDDYKNNMAWPTITNFKQNCPDGWIHVPHIFYELYWNTPMFDDLWTPDGKTQPFVLSNGDATGYSLHGDFIAGWDLPTLNGIIKDCNAGDIGMDTCDNIIGGLNDNKDCKISSPVVELLSLTGALTALPGDNPVTGWSFGGSSDSGTDASSSSSAADYATTAASAAKSSSTSASSAQEETSTYAAVSLANLDGKKGKASSSSTEAAATVPTEAAVTAVANNAGYNTGVSTVWDIVTATETMTVWVEETAPVKRQEQHAGHIARHRRSGHFRH